MISPYVTIIAAVAVNRAIGLRGKMPWHLPDELRHFKKMTLGKPVIMGRKTHESIGMVLPGRQNIVVTRNAEYASEGVDVATSLQHALEIGQGGELMVIGGGELYRLALPLASRLLLTVVDYEPEGDTFFPEWRNDNWALAGSVTHDADEQHAHSFQLQEWLRA
ncbi:MAG: dihydrofolate reductase [Xanthomonadales bacterium]|nr:dihydrofolate reductase [Xanthomonadales bacterium]